MTLLTIDGATYYTGQASEGCPGAGGLVLRSGEYVAYFTQGSADAKATFDEALWPPTEPTWPVMIGIYTYAENDGEFELGDGPHCQVLARDLESAREFATWFKWP